MASSSLCIAALAVLCLSLSSASDLIIEPNVRSMHVPKGSTQRVTCKLNHHTEDTADLKWQTPFNQVTYPDRAVSSDVTASKNEDGTYLLQLVLTVSDFDRVLDGQYMCVQDGASQKTTTIIIQTIQVLKSEEVYHYGNKTVTLFCRLDGIKIGRFDITWKKFEQTLSAGEKYQMSKENGTITINKLDRDDAAQYRAEYDLVDLDEKFVCELDYTAGPLVLDMDKSISRQNEETVEIDCDVKGWPRPEVTWHKGEKQVEESERITFSALNGYEDARLTITDLEFDDKGDYLCRAYSERFNKTAEKSIKLRVKDKLGWLVPFIGIIVEVIVLIVLIFIFEKCKKRKESRSEAANHPHSQ